MKAKRIKELSNELYERTTDFMQEELYHLLKEETDINVEDFSEEYFKVANKVMDSFYRRDFFKHVDVITLALEGLKEQVVDVLKDDNNKIDRHNLKQVEKALKYVHNAEIN